MKASIVQIPHPKTSRNVTPRFEVHGVFLSKVKHVCLAFRVWDKVLQFYTWTLGMVEKFRFPEKQQWNLEVSKSDCESSGFFTPDDQDWE